MTQEDDTSSRKINRKVQSVDFLTRSDFESGNQRALLLHNLQHCGWSPISILVKAKNNANEKWIQAPTKEAVLESMMNQHLPRFIHRTAESGAKGGTFVEPKESLELKRSDVVLGTKQESSLVDEWCWAMSEIAHSVSQLLELPTNTLLVQEDEDDEGTKKDEKKDDAVSGDTHDNCLDLMRVFSYHQTPDGPQLGSSPHTDWGSWTIVWQDNVGGLETYSRENQQWEPVPTVSSNTTYDSVDSAAIWHCIVHVGDMASLALQKSPSDKEVSPDNQASTCYYWPSPEHRVQTSITQKRASLVYFGYPPANTSILEIRQRLKDWKPSCRGSPLPLTEYYLLQNQSSSTNETMEDSNAKERQLQEYYEKLEKLSIQEVIQAKWNQVQRSNY